MRTFTSALFIFFLGMGALQAQLFLVNSPEEIRRYYSFSAAGFGADLTTQVWTADVAVVDDGSANPTFACNAPINAAELAGKFALIDRGACEFGLKSLNAQNAGAIGVIVFNNAPGAGHIVMGPGAVGDQVTIPCLMLSYEDGQTIRAALAQGAVNVSFGALSLPANDLALGLNRVVFPPLGIVPSSQLKAAGDFVFTPGAVTANIGANDADNVTVNLTIEHTPFGGSPAALYDETITVTDFLEADSSSELTFLPSFDPISTGEGNYTFAYTVSSDSMDNSPFDNRTTGSFAVSKNLYSKAAWNPATGDPRTTVHYRRAAGPDLELFTVLNIPHGFGYRIDTIVFSVSTSAVTPGGLANVAFDAYVYEWNDLNEDGDISNDEVAILGIGDWRFPEDFEPTQAVLRLSVLDLLTFEPGIIIPEDNKDYIIGVRYQAEDGDGDIFLGFDQSQNYLQYLNSREADGTLTDRDYGYWLVSSWIDALPDFSQMGIFSNLWAAVSTGVIVNEIVDVSTQEVVGPDVFEVKLFPNPAAEYLQVNLEFNQPTNFVEYVITDMAGRLLFTQRDTEVFETEQATFNVSQLPAGRYNLLIRTQQGIRVGGFVKQ